MTDQTLSWKYLLIYLHDPKNMETWRQMPLKHADLLLCEVLAPLLEAYADALDGYYYLRYGMNGYHIRLRWRGTARVHATLSADLKARISVFFAEHADALHIDANSLNDLIAAERLQYADYEPEFEKYGGKIGMSLAEQHFQTSSRICWQVLQAEQQHRVSRAKFALELMDKLVKSLLPDAHEQAIWARSVAAFWMSNISLQPIDEDIPAIVERHAHAQEKQVYDWLWQYPEKRLEARYDDVDFALWDHDLTENLRLYCELETDGRLITPLKPYLDKLMPDLQAYETIKRYPLTTFVILPNYLHMLNNRLGLTALQEVQLATLYQYAIEFHYNLSSPTIPLILEPDALYLNLARS